MPTRILTASQVTSLVEVDHAFEALREGVRRSVEGGIPGQRVATRLPGTGTATALIPGLLAGVPAYTVKVNAKFPDATPALRGVVALHSLHDGELLALIDSASLTAWRTGLTAALAIDALAAPEAAGVAFVGAGAQATVVLLGLCRLRKLTRVVVCDLDHERTRAFIERQVPEGVPALSAPDPVAAAQLADIVVLATWSRLPLLGWDDLRPGQHLTTLGADEVGKVELAAEVLRRGWLVVDDVELVARSGAVANAGLSSAAIDATLTQVLGGNATPPGADRVTVYAPVGLPWQDLALAWPLYQAAQATGVGLDVDMLG
jgi:alanine dehydrogenase